MRRQHRVIGAAKAKLASSRGETLVEVLASVLVAGLSILMLGMAISVSMNLVSQNKDVASGYYASTDALASGTATAEGKSGSGTVNVVANGSGFAGGTVDVTYVEEELLGGTSGVSYEGTDG